MDSSSSKVHLLTSTYISPKAQKLGIRKEAWRDIVHALFIMVFVLATLNQIGTASFFSFFFYKELISQTLWS